MFLEYIKTVTSIYMTLLRCLHILMTVTFEAVVGGRREVYFPPLIPIAATNAMTELQTNTALYTNQTNGVLSNTNAMIRNQYSPLSIVHWSV